MSSPVFETKYVGSKVRVFADHVEWKMLLQSKSVPINQIASVELGIPMYAQVVIETTGGKKFKIPVALGQKKALQDAILSQMGKGTGSTAVGTSSLDELKKLGELKQSGVITDEEFEKKKRELLG